MRFDDYIEATNAAETPDALFGVLERVVEQEGFTRLAYSCLSGPMPAKAAAELAPPASASVVFLKFPERWVEHYLQNDCHLIDPVLQHALTQARPFTWDSLLQQPTVERESKIFMMDAERAGLRDGITIPMTGPQGNAFLLSLAREDYGDDPVRLIDFLNAFALQFHFSYCNMAEFRPPQPDVALPERVVQCLTLLAAGRVPSEISDELGIPERMVHAHFKTAANMLGTSTMVQTVFEAIRSGIVPPEAVGKKTWKK